MSPRAMSYRESHLHAVASERAKYVEPLKTLHFPASADVPESQRGEPIKTWKVWERGAPDVAIEVNSDTDSKPGPWEENFATHQSLGVQELVAINLLTEHPKLRVWNRVDEVLTERLLDGSHAESLVLDLHWIVAPLGSTQALRIATQLEPLTLVPTEAERAQLESVKGQQADERALKAEARVKELEELLRTRESGQ